MFIPIPTQVARREGRIYGTAFLDPYDAESPKIPVDGLYDVSMIDAPVAGTTHSRRETVAFLRNGTGPDQIPNPIGLPSVSIEWAK